MKKIQKSFTIIAIAVCVLTIGISIVLNANYKKKNATYTSIAVVNAVDYVEPTGQNEVYFMLENGQIFYIRTKDIYDLKEKYILTFDSNGTSSPLDDKIIEIKRPI